MTVIYISRLHFGTHLRPFIVQTPNQNLNLTLHKYTLILGYVT
jgi:hypothetical protein